MGIEFIARAVPLPGSIREVPISVKERVRLEGLRSPCSVTAMELI